MPGLPFYHFTILAPTWFTVLPFLSITALAALTVHTIFAILPPNAWISIGLSLRHVSTIF